MAKGALYPIYTTLYLYSNAAQAQAYGSNYASTLSPNTGGDASSYNCISSVEGKGNLYVDTTFGLNSSYYPAFTVWWVPSAGGGGYAIGWTNDKKNYSASIPTTNKSSYDIGESVMITFNRQSSSFSHTVDYWLIGTGWTNLVNKSSTATYTWNTNNYRSTLLNALPSVTSGNFQLRVSTYNGTTLLGTKYKDLLLKIPANIKPSISSITATETNTLLSNTLGLGFFVRGVSKIKASASGVTAGQGSTINSYSWQIYNSIKSGASPTFDPLNFSSGVFKLTVYDRRGRSTTLTSSNIQQVAYSKPSISTFKVARYNSENPVKVNFTLKASATKLNVSGTNKNTIRYKIDKKKSNETAWSSHKAFSSYQATDINLSASTLADIENDGKYNLRVTVEDRVGNSTTFTVTLNSTSKKWLEVTNGENINVIGNLLNNGTPMAKVYSGNTSSANDKAVFYTTPGKSYIISVFTDSALESNYALYWFVYRFNTERFLKYEIFKGANAFVQWQTDGYLTIFNSAAATEYRILEMG